ncbi:MAG: hypothetical protein QW409_03645 [Candidatus Aenigmatarchaeota archaeon]
MTNKKDKNLNKKIKIFVVGGIVLLLFLIYSFSQVIRDDLIECSPSSILVSCKVNECHEGIVTIKTGDIVYHKTITPTDLYFDFVPFSPKVRIDIFCKFPFKISSKIYELKRTEFNLIPSKNSFHQVIADRGCYIIRSTFKNNKPVLEIESYYSDGCSYSNLRGVYYIELLNYHPIYKGCICLTNEGILVSQSKDIVKITTVSLGKKDEIAILLKKGWNLISNPSDNEITFEKIREEGCFIDNKFYSFNSTSKSWNIENKILPDSRGYWIYVTSGECVLNLKISEKIKERGISFSKGWNLIMGIEGIDCYSLKRYGCNVKMINENCFFSFKDGYWFIERKMEIGRGYWVYCE